MAELTYVMPGLVPGIQPTASAGAGRSLDSGNKCRNDTVRWKGMPATPYNADGAMPWRN
jgi:hypothetical protein